MIEISCNIAVVGAGPHALTLLAYFLQKRKSWRQRIMVFDRSGEWLSQWRRQFAQLEIPHLRSPAAHHPDPNPFALRRFAENRPHELHLASDLPGTGLFNQFCDRVVEHWQLQQRVVAADVAHIEPLNPGFRLTLSNGNICEAKQVVLANGGGTKFLPDWVSQIMTAYPDRQLQHSSQIDLRQLHCSGERILIIGSGLTSGHLAVGAVHRGAIVTMMARRNFYAKLFDADPGWFRPKYLKGFQAETCWEKRWDTVMSARNGGSLTPAVMAQLRQLKAQGKVLFREHCQVQSAEWRSPQWQVDCINAAGQTATESYDRIWLATGSTIRAEAHPLLQAIQANTPIPIIRGLPALSPQLSWGKQQLYLMGGLAALQVGPTARNLAGARLASDRIVDGLLRARY